VEDEKQKKDAQLAELAQRRLKIAEMGGKDRVASQKKKNKLTARERIDLLLDKGTFHELWMFGTSRGTQPGLPGDAVVTITAK
jgi:acetyl-CoA carboxylase carboxyltransferase component